MKMRAGFGIRAWLAAGLLVCSLWAIPQPAQAKPGVGAIMLILQNAAAVMTSAGRCVVFTYDQNGNRLTQTVSVPSGATPVWGSASYGCFAWQQ